MPKLSFLEMALGILYAALTENWKSCLSILVCIILLSVVISGIVYLWI